MAEPAATVMDEGVLEREDELAAIRRTLERATHGQGRLLVIEGPSGIGKSRLLAAARREAAAIGFDVLHARGGELERDYTFGVVLRLLEARIARAPAEQRQRLLRGSAALAKPLVAAPEQPLSHVATTDQFALIHGLYWCIVNLAEQAPVALVVDDVHWADDLSLRFLLYLAERLEDLPAALIVGLRTGDPETEFELASRLAAAPEGQRVRPVELSLDAVAGLIVEAGVESRQAEELADACWRATGGNPLLVRELIAAIQDERLGMDAERIEASVPRAVRRRLIARLEWLGDDAGAVARACAVVGDDAPLATIAHVAGIPLAAACAAAHRLVSAHMLGDVDPVSFTHPIIRSAIYGELAPTVAAAAHADAARLLATQGVSPEQVAHHLVAGATVDEPWAVQALHDGARAAARKGAPATATRFLRHALALEGHGDRSASMLVDLGLVEAAAGEITSLARFEGALATIPEPAEQARALHALGQTLYRYGRHAEAAETFARGAELFEGRDPEVVRAFLGAFMCSTYYDAATHAAALPRLEELVAEIPADRPPTTAERVLLAVRGLHTALATAPASESAGLFGRALTGREAVREYTLDGIGINIAVTGLWLAGRAAEAEHVADEVVASARERGSTLAFAEASSVRALVSLARGKLIDAAADAQAAIGMIDRGWRGSGVLPHATLAQCLVERAQLDEAQSVLSAAEPMLMANEGILNCFFYCARGRLRHVRGDTAGALEDFLMAGRELRPYGPDLNPTLVPWRSLAGVAAHAVGHPDRALSLIEEELSLARRFALPVQIGVALRARGSVVAEDRALEDLNAAVEILGATDAPLEYARALLSLGGAQRRAGARVKSREPLRHALDIAHRLSATRLEGEARDELLASGARPRRATLAGVSALTPSEYRIAALAAQGQTNRQIAESLFLTQNTVAWHLSHVYRKLDVSSRTELHSLLRSPRHDVTQAQ
jgi:DNA-binding CsgD family transcriptional regulator